MSRLGKTTKKYYAETKGIKVSGGQMIKSGQMLTRQGNKWKPGLNVTGRMHLTALCDGTVYFTRKRGRYNKEQTFINIKPVEKK
ncbi:MAG TPA: 50S ribosomal protein L27 [Candidatus Omnitrophota bacterium]|nr:50S ribosomal protein L27 [Candidatus Omnitrophota bacterium]HPN87789.1 50S ribosomal protein L27 [Candidatus Omnitrophota bacterium]